MNLGPVGNPGLVDHLCLDMETIIVSLGIQLVSFASYVCVLPNVLGVNRNDANPRLSAQASSPQMLTESSSRT